MSERRLIRGGDGLRGRQGLDEAAGISPEDAGVTGIFLHLTEIPKA